MNIKVVAFGIAKDILKGRELQLEVKDASTVADVKERLKTDFPAFQKLVKFSLAVGEEYRNDDFVISENQEVIVIPPVAGG
jgi:molybdopterin converting factor small subunit